MRGRRNRANLSGVTVNMIDLKHPWVVACWGFFFPGFGQARLCKYLEAWTLIVWELAVNTLSHLNLAIMYTLTGRFELAKEVLDKRIVFLYLPVYVFSVWNSYRESVELNKIYVMADKEDAKLQPYHIGPFEINYLDKREPKHAVLWSAFVPGLGQVLNHRLPSGVFILVWWIVIVYMSHGLEGLWFTMTGQFAKAVQLCDPQWLLYLPSMYGYAVYDAYCTAVEYNKLFKKEQSQFLRQNYQSRQFPMYVNERLKKEDHSCT